MLKSLIDLKLTFVRTSFNPLYQGLINHLKLKYNHVINNLNILNLYILYITNKELLSIKIYYQRLSIRTEISSL